MIEDTAENLAKIADLGREAWVFLAAEISHQKDADEIWEWLPELRGEEGE